MKKHEIVSILAQNSYAEVYGYSSGKMDEYAYKKLLKYPKRLLLELLEVYKPKEA